MPVRIATKADIPVMVRVYAASFGPDRLFRVLFPRMDEYPREFARALEEHLWLAWYDYSKVMMVSYQELRSEEGEETPLLSVSVKDDNDDTNTRRKQVIITGTIEWQRNGQGWEHLNRVWGRLDPRRLMRPILSTYYKIKRFFFPNKASVKPTRQEPNPLTYWNVMSECGPFVKDFYNAPHRQKNFWSLENLAVHPDHQGKGYGRELVEYGIENFVRADPNGELPANVVAADGKEFFYQKCGFRELVGFICDTVDDQGRDNPLRSNGVGGGAILWTK